MPSPAQVLREAIAAVPAVRYALGIGGIVATVALIYSLKIDPRIAFVGSIVMLVLMATLVIFARMSALSSTRLIGPVITFTWFTLLLFIFVATSLFTSVFYREPVDLQFWLTGQKTILQTPKLYRPFDNTVFDNFPRTTTVAWEAGNEATHYVVEVQYSMPFGSEWYDLPISTAAVENAEYTFKFSGAQPGRWRVTAVFDNGEMSPPSKWWHFRYTK